MRRLLSVLTSTLVAATLVASPALAQDDLAQDDLAQDDLAQDDLAQDDLAQDEDPGRYQDDGDAGGFRNIMPPGQDGVLNAAELLAAQGGTFPAHFSDQTAPYEQLVYEGGLPVDGQAGEPFLGLTDGDLERFFKDASFGADGDVAMEDVSMCGDVIAFRDTAFGVPHIYGQTREAAQCANGYLTAADRLFVMDLLRHVGRARMSEFLGASEANMAMDRSQLMVAPYTEADFEQQRADLCESEDPERQRVCADGIAYIEGVNAYIADARSDPSLLPGEYLALQIMPEEFVVADIIATASLVGGIFGKGGGGEAANSMFYAALVAEHGEQEARAIFDDLKGADDPDGSLTTQTPFPYNQHDDIDPTTTALLQPGSLVDAFGATSGGTPGLPELAIGTFARLGLSALAGVDTLLTPAVAPAEPAQTTLGIVDGPFGPIDLRTPLVMSNAILAGAEVSDAGIPIAVFGPQTGYFTPQLLVESDIHAPGLDARGTAFAGTNIYVQLGRGVDYAWSATSASGDLVDEWALELCDPAGGDATIESTGYLWDGVCTEIPVLTHTQIAKPSAGGIPDPSPEPVVVTLEIGRIPELGDAPVVGHAVTTDGVPVAIAEQRSTFNSELNSAIGFQRINDPTFMTEGAESFNRAFDGVDYTFNWFYVDDTDIAYRHSCLCPVRDPVTDPDLLTWGGRGHQWTGAFLQPAQQPQAINPDEGFLANWNNRQAPGFRAEDSTFKHHSTDRREHLALRMEHAVASGVPITRGDMVNIVEDAGTVDLNGQEIYGLALQIMGEDPPESLGDGVRLFAMRARLAAWVAAGGHRRDVDRDGMYDHAVAVAIGDAWVRPMIDAVLGDDVDLALWPEGVENHPRDGVGSAYNSGRMRFLQKDFWQVLDLPMQAPRSRTYCADATVAGCGAVLWEALAAAAVVLGSAPEEEGCDHPAAVQFGSPALEDWVYAADCDNIIQGAAGVVAAPEMRWVNRPTFQQVVQVGAMTGRIGGRDRVATAAALSRHAFAEGAGTVVVAAAGTFADAVAGTPLAAANDAPLLLTELDRLSPATEHEVRRLGASHAIVLGGTAAVSDAVTSRLEELDLTVTRVAGGNRFETSVAIAAELGQGDRFVLASGTVFPDALAAGPFAVLDDRAILLVERDGMQVAVADLLDQASDVVIAGGPAAISSALEESLPAESVARLGGADRYGTGAAFTAAAQELGAAANPAYGVTGEAFPDALTAGAVAVRTGGSLVLLQPDALDNAPAGRDLLVAAAEDVGPRARIWLVGGEAALPSSLRAALEALV